MSPRSTWWLALGALFFALPASAAPIVLEGDVPQGGPDHFFLEFDVPAGTKEIEIKHDDLSEDDVLDFGVLDPDGYRGWGGGTEEPTIIGETAASRAYVPGPIKEGKWRVVVGKAKIVSTPARYKVEIDLRTTPTLAPVARRPYAAPPARKQGTRYYAGDFHVHSRESTDASATLDENIVLAKSLGLDFIEISDHNTITQLDFFGEAHDKHPDFLLLPGIEFTTYAGHANAIGATKWVDHKIGQPGVTIAGAAEAIRAQGAILSINHPVIDVGNACIGCAWKHDLDPSMIGGVEIATLGLTKGGSLFSSQAIAFWDGLLDKGAKIPAIGGSDDHKAGTATGFLPAKVGSPTTLIRASELSVNGILDGIRKGATVVKLDSNEDAMVELEAVTKTGGEGLAFPGDTLGVRSIILRARVTKGAGGQIRFVKNGQPLEFVAVPSDPYDYEMKVEPPQTGEDRWRAEALVEEKPRTVTSHIWLKADPAGPVAEDPPEDDGCRASRGSTPNAIAVALFVLAALVVKRVVKRVTS